MRLEVPTATSLVWSRISPSLNSVQIPVWQDFQPYDVRGTGEVHVVLIRAEGGGPVSRYHSLQRPVVALNVFSDSQRDDDGRVTAHNAASRALAVHEFLAPLLHGCTWDSVIRCELRQEPAIIVDPDSDNESVLLHSLYGLDINAETPVPS